MNDKTNIAREGDEHRNAIGRRRRIYVRVTEDELARIRSRARKAGMSISAFARTRLLGEIKRSGPRWTSISPSSARHSQI